jgi:hypothetical protein
MFAWAIRQKEPCVRCPLVLILFPFDLLPLVWHCLWTGRAFQREFWINNEAIFWAAFNGAFVK